LAEQSKLEQAEQKRSSLTTRMSRQLDFLRRPKDAQEVEMETGVKIKTVSIDLIVEFIESLS
jgi:hypothetical protein